MPTLAGFTNWVQVAMGLSVAALASAQPTIPVAYNVALATVSMDLAQIGNPSGIDDQSIYSLAVYNLGGDRLINYAQDIAPDTTFAGLRSSLKITNFLAGVVQSSGDDGTNQSLLVPDAFAGLTIMDLQNLKTPYGQQYLAFAQMAGSLWGLS